MICKIGTDMHRLVFITISDNDTDRVLFSTITVVGTAQYLWVLYSEVVLFMQNGIMQNSRLYT